LRTHNEQTLAGLQDCAGDQHGTAIRRVGPWRLARTTDGTHFDAVGRSIIWAPYRTVASWYLWRSLELPE
jgi:hypothetical protein